MNSMNLLFSVFGGMIGAIFGPITTFIVVGFVGLAGVIATISGSTFDWIGIVALGPIFGPHVAFVGGVAAAAYAKKIGGLESGKDIVTPLLSIKKPSVILVGGIFGSAGYLLNDLLATLFPGKFDSLAFTIVITAIVAKILFGELGLSGIYGSTPKEIKEAGGRFSSRSPIQWLPYLSTGVEKLLVACSLGGASAYITYIMLQNPETAGVAAFVGFFMSAASLLWLINGFAIPVTHHMTLCASYAVVASGGSIVWGITGAIIAAFAADFLAQAFLLYGSDVHVDPPSMGIAVTSLLLLTVFPAMNLTNSVAVIGVVLVGCLVVILKQETHEKSVRKISQVD
ncbi:hypothetical protein SANA_20790 [Gottschalkiaceae bacterium SANA]|nr:hypothetical protein SANA_20790 [Gottschalkiaceae bacterium SANA]